MNKFFITKSAKETQKFAADFVKKILKIKSEKAIIVGLIGELGVGKTIFAKGFAKGLGINEVITSPTFVLERIYRFRPKADPPRAEKDKSFKLFIHIDAYRIGKAKEITDLGFKDLARDSRNIILIEWADRVKKILPKNYIEIKFEHTIDNRRKITIGQLSDRDK